jgi:multiple sugar transport system ATP-binding protein
MPRISLENVTKKFKKIVALNNLSFEINDGEFFVILGPSGAGKTTFLKVIAGLENPEEGKIYFDGNVINNVDTANRDVALTFENYSLYPHFTVFNNIATPLKSPVQKNKYDTKQIEGKIDKLTKMLSINHLLDRLPSELSGGQKQRVALGRALVKEPKVLLLDEPLAHVDAKIRNQLRTEFHFLKEKFRTTTIYTSHDYKEAISLGDRMMLLNMGKIEQIGIPEKIYNFPKNTWVALRVGWPEINLFDCTVNFENSQLYSPKGDFAFNISSHILKHLKNYGKSEYIVGIRSHYINFSDKPADAYSVKAICGMPEVLDNQLVFVAKVNNLDLTISTHDPDLSLKYEQELWLGFDDQSLTFFDKETNENIKLKE